MRPINRCVAVVKVKQPFLDWVEGLPDSLPGTTLAEMNDDGHTYLLPEYQMKSDQDEILAAFFDDIFVNELMAWWTDEADFPKKRTLAMFRRWFDVEFHSMVIDTIDSEPIEHEDLGLEEDDAGDGDDKDETEGEPRVRPEDRN